MGGLYVLSLIFRELLFSEELLWDLKSLQAGKPVTESWFPYDDDDLI